MYVQKFDNACPLTSKPCLLITLNASQITWSTEKKRLNFNNIIGFRSELVDAKGGGGGVGKSPITTPSALIDPLLTFIHLLSTNINSVSLDIPSIILCYIYYCRNRCIGLAIVRLNGYMNKEMIQQQGIAILMIPY